MSGGARRALDRGNEREEKWRGGLTLHPCGGGEVGARTQGAQSAADSCARVAEAATVGWHTDRVGRWLRCGPTDTVPGGGEI
jgi:hypothetical protein